MELQREKIVPHLKQRRRVFLYPTQGKVFCITEFAKNNIDLLALHESQLIKDYLFVFPQGVPKFLSRPLTTLRQHSTGAHIAIAEAVGSRSAYSSIHKMKLKGCRPISNLYFPYEQLNFGSKGMTTRRINFGTLSASNVMGEIFAYCFFKKFNLSILHKPICVFEYIVGTEPVYCLVLSTPTENRLESHEDFFGLTLRDVIALRKMEKNLGHEILPMETRFKNIQPAWYAKNKSFLLAQMNFHGGFRGILNSNIGNDLVYKNKFYICDFDTFHVIEIPSRPSIKFIENFTLWCIVEVMKSSLFVLDYLDVEHMQKYQRTLALWASYSEHSTLWQAYRHYFSMYARQRGWDAGIVELAQAKALQSDVVQNLILDNVLNSHVLKTTYKLELSFYVPHNY